MMGTFIYGMIFGTGIVVWSVIILALLWLIKASADHGIASWQMSGRIVRGSATKSPRLRWWWHMFLHGPMDSMTTIDDGHKIYWPGREPKGWYGGSPHKGKEETDG